MSPPPIEVVHVQAFEKDRLVFIDRRGAIWCTFSRPLWDVLAWLWWWLQLWNRWGRCIGWPELFAKGIDEPGNKAWLSNDARASRRLKSTSATGSQAGKPAHDFRQI